MNCFLTIFQVSLFFKKIYFHPGLPETSNFLAKFSIKGNFFHTFISHFYFNLFDPRIENSMYFLILPSRSQIIVCRLLCSECDFGTPGWKIVHKTRIKTVLISTQVVKTSDDGTELGGAESEVCNILGMHYATYFLI